MVDRVALFVTCLADTLFPQVGQATVTVLERLGIEVVFPLEQTCCGQMHANSGYPGEAELLARRFVEIFDGFDAIVTPSGSCAAQVREHIPGPARRRRPRRSGADVGAVAVPHRRARRRRGRLERTRARSPTTRPAIRCDSSASATRRCACCVRRPASSSSSCRTRRSAAASAARSRSRTRTSRRRCSTRSWRRSSRAAPPRCVPATARA